MIALENLIALVILFIILPLFMFILLKIDDWRNKYHK